jgi:hypothetical protein
MLGRILYIEALTAANIGILCGKLSIRISTLTFREIFRKFFFGGCCFFPAISDEVSYGYPTAAPSFTTGDLSTSGYSMLIHNTYF